MQLLVVMLSGKDALDYELTLSASLKAPYPVDLRLLNSALKGFQNNVAHSGELLFSRDKKILGQFLERAAEAALFLTLVKLLALW